MKTTVPVYCVPGSLIDAGHPGFVVCPKRDWTLPNRGGRKENVLLAWRWKKKVALEKVETAGGELAGDDEPPSPLFVLFIYFESE